VSHLTRFIEVSLLLRLQVKTTDVSFLVACLARSFSGGRHAPSTAINSSMKNFKAPCSNNLLEKSLVKKYPENLIVPGVVVKRL
jgi:hypothetical protein